MGRRDDDEPQQPWRVRLGWLLLIWAASVGALGVVAFVIKQFMRLAHMTA